MSKNKKIITGLIMGAAALAIMLFASMPSANSKEISIADLIKDSEKYEGEYLMTQGLLRADTIQWDDDNIQLDFEIVDENDLALPVYHKGIKPDNFSEGIIVIVEGFLNEQGVFEAEKVRTKCPSKYESEDMDNYDIDTHKKILEEQTE